MECECASFLPIELDRPSVNRRIRESKAIKRRLITIVTNEHYRIALLRCPVCDQYWQTGHEWNFADQEYIFQVPPIEQSDWLTEPYVQPAALMIFSAVMERFFSQGAFKTKDVPCREPGCNEHAIQLSVRCMNHHIEALRKSKLLPAEPIGRMFPPYHIAPAKSI
jgi:hypothetical protein